MVGLGRLVSGYLTENDKLAKQIFDAGEKSADRTWRLPLWEEYQQELDSNFADVANIGGRWGGALTAACFLARFTKRYTWAHLDIAGVANKTGKEKGSTGRPVPLLVDFLLNRCGY